MLARKLFISSQTYEGLKITVNSVIDATQFLLQHQVKYVLTESFRTSDHVDFRKVYDSIWREALFYKLSAYYDVRINFINILHNMYNKIHLSVHSPNGITQSFSSNIGLSQGCNLSPILFNIFINYLNEIFDKTFSQPAKI